MINPESNKTSPRIAFTEVEINILDKLAKNKGDSKPKYLSDYLMQVAKLGGYLARNYDSPPGNTIIWRGLSSLMFSLPC